MRRTAALLSALIALAGCATSLRDRAWLDRQLDARTGASTRARSSDRLPCGVRLDDGLDDADVTALALCRSPALRAELPRIDAALATLDEARRPANPQLALQGPIGPLTAVATLLAPLESLWQLPARSEVAAREADATGEAVLVRALDVVRDARLLHVEWGLAADRARLREELAAVAGETARVAAARAQVGDVGPLDERLPAAEARASADASEGAALEAALARARLVAALALDDDAALRPVFASELPAAPPLRAMLAVARAARPDGRSAELAIAAVAARARWERARVVSLGALVEAQWNQPAGPGVRLGARVEAPLFSQNQGGIGRAEADLERATAQLELVARTVTLEVTTAHARYEQAARSRRRFDDEVLPALDAALSVARESVASGDQPLLVVLEVLRRVGEARLRRAELLAEQRRARCELERAIGARLERASDVADAARRERGAR